jgi:hypothetical protein
MPRRAVKLISLLSSCLLAVSILLLLCCGIFSDGAQCVSFNDSFHVRLICQGFDARIAFFSDAEYGPYRGSLIGLQDSDGMLEPPLESQIVFGDSWGIYYRYFQWSDSRLWTLTLSLWYPVILFSTIPLTVLSHELIRRRNSTKA